MPDQSPFIWHELVTADQPTSGAFFSQLFGWARKEVDQGRKPGPPGSRQSRDFTTKGCRASGTSTARRGSDLNGG